MSMIELLNSKAPVVFKRIRPGEFNVLPLSFPLELDQGESVCADERVGIAKKNESFADFAALVRWIDSQHQRV